MQLRPYANPSVSTLSPWAQFGAGHEGRVLPLFQTGGHNMPCPPTFFSLGFVFGEVSKIKAMFVTFCVMSRASFCNFCNFLLQLPTVS